MYYAEIKSCDIANGPGCRVSLFVSGCRNHCKGCFQPETWDFTYGKIFTDETERKILGQLAPIYINGLSLLGGDPFEPENQQRLAPFLRRVKDAYPKKSIWAYTGHIYEQIVRDGSKTHCDATDTMLSCIDVLVDGPFIEARKDISLRFRGSSNQRIIDVKKTQCAGHVVLKSGMGDRRARRNV